MKNNSFLVSVIFFMAIFCFAGFSFAAEEVVPPSEELEAEQLKISNKIIRINAREGAFPQTFTSEPGTTVIWINNANSILEVLFLDKKVTLACGSPVNFFVGKDGAYESGKIPYGGTASLCFLEKGTYEYMVRVNRTWLKPALGGMAKDHRGRIVIK
jgi:plastocyanin